MAPPIVAAGTKLLLRIANADGEGEGEELVYTSPCGITTKTFTFDATTNEIDLPDCDDDEAVAWVANEKQNMRLNVTGSGVLDTTVLDTYWDFFKDPEARSCQLAVNVAAGVGGGHWLGNLHLTSFGVTGERGQKITVDLTLVSDGEVEWVPAT